MLPSAPDSNGAACKAGIEGDWSVDEPEHRWSVADSLRRLLDQRDEQRSEGEAQGAILIHDGRQYAIDVLNLSGSGAMIRHAGELAEGADVQLQLLDQAPVAGQVRWIRDGRVGVAFDAPINQAENR